MVKIIKDKIWQTIYLYLCFKKQYLAIQLPESESLAVLERIKPQSSWHSSRVVLKLTLPLRRAITNSWLRWKVVKQPERDAGWSLNEVIWKRKELTLQSILSSTDICKARVTAIPLRGSEWVKPWEVHGADFTWQSCSAHARRQCNTPEWDKSKQSVDSPSMKHAFKWCFVENCVRININECEKRGEQMYSTFILFYLFFIFYQIGTSYHD